MKFKLFMIQLIWAVFDFDQYSKIFASVHSEIKLFELCLIKQITVRGALNNDNEAFFPQ